MINEKSNRFPRSERLSFLQHCLDHNDVKGLKILDYGGNAGNLLLDGLETGEIVQSDYTCLDVDKLVLDQAREEHPEAEWVYYDRFNQHYNPTGQKRIPFPFEDNTFDVAFVYSVHTHCSYEDFVFDLKELRRVAKKVFTSYIDPQMAKYIAMKRTFDYGEIHPDWQYGKLKEITSYKYFIDADTTTTNSDEIKNNCDFLITVYDTEWLLKQHPEITKVIPTMDMVNDIHGVTQPFLVIDG